MKTILDAAAREELRDRMGRLDEGAQARWGEMSVGQMVCHVADPMRVALGEMAAEDASNVFTRTVLKRLVLWGAPPPKAKVKTFPEIDQALGAGTHPGALSDDVRAFGTLLDRFAAHAEAGRPLAPSPIFGPMNGEQWGRLLYGHTNHHLKQFGV